MIPSQWFLLLIFLHPSHQTNIEYHDGPTREHSHIVQTCRFIHSGDCCVPVDLLPPQSDRVVFQPYKIVFEYFSKNSLYVFADAENRRACNGPSVDAYRDRAAQGYFKDFVARPGRRFSGALFTEQDGLIRAGQIKYPWSIRYQDTLYYQLASTPLVYTDAYRRSFLHVIPQFGRSIAISTHVLWY